jgi:phosphoglucomutase
MPRLAGKPIVRVLVEAPGDGAAIGGIKVIAASGWFAARPSGTEDIYRIYAESFASAEHLQRLMMEAQPVVDQAIGAPSWQGV